MWDKPGAGVRAHINEDGGILFLEIKVQFVNKTGLRPTENGELLIQIFMKSK